MGLTGDRTRTGEYRTPRTRRKSQRSRCGIRSEIADSILVGCAGPNGVAFTLPVNGVSDPIVTDTGAVIVKVVEKKDVTAEDLGSGRQALKEEMLSSQRNRFYGAYMAKVRERLRDRIEIKTEVLTQLLGP